MVTHALIPIWRRCGQSLTLAVPLRGLDERVTRSPVGDGWTERTQFVDACASSWIDGELVVHLEDLMLHDACHERAPRRMC